MPPDDQAQRTHPPQQPVDLNIIPSLPSYPKPMRSWPKHNHSSNTRNAFNESFHETEMCNKDRDRLFTFEFACEHGDLSTVQSIIASRGILPEPAFLHWGLIQGIRAGQLEVVNFLLASGAPIGRQTAFSVLNAPPAQQLPLFELLTKFGWIPATAGYHGDMILPYIVSDHNLLLWFLAHSVDPNHGRQPTNNDIFAGPDTQSGAAIEAAAKINDIKALRSLVNSGANAQYGAPLHYAAGMCPPGIKLPYGQPRPSKDFDMSTIPVMALLVEQGADVNRPARFFGQDGVTPLMYAAIAGAVERVKWLLEHGADPTLEGPWGSAATIAIRAGGVMKQVMEDSIGPANKIS
ncbi:hypothetical protein N7492_007158 [Penicillium capsulatum]|uniref:Ankyrin repeat-containing domain protein n=1 Tax=Penicillium capsulatum TaxID=69766 RepID=A0A9W9I1S4_9EURO|nr:hypothetical protein N7492_007158 [Penicillium capsulatum]KAJ6116995.1 hypothetical protein N7512_006720 [Penicillium capsulatum]